MRGGMDPTIGMGCEIDVEPTPITYRKRGGKHSLANVTKAYNTSQKITKEKKTDLIALLPHLTSKQIGTLFYILVWKLFLNYITNSISILIKSMWNIPFA